MMDALLSISEPWLQYGIRYKLFEENKTELLQLRNQVLEDVKIKEYLKDVAAFHTCVVSSHKNPELPIHKLLFLLELGLDRNVPEINQAIDEIMKHKDGHGVYQSLTNIPKHYGGTGEDSFGWSLCDAPLMLLALIRAGVDYEQYIQQGVEHLVSLFQNQGFPCAVSFEHGKFRGPGKKEDSCAYATLIMLKLFAEIPAYQNSDISKAVVQKMFSLWQNSRNEHPYMFYMGTDFRKLKAPAIWYDIVSVLEVLSRFETAKADERFAEMLSVIENKQDENGLFTPESIYLKCKDWDFGQKKVPSPYLTYLCLQIFKRSGKGWR